MCFLDTCINLIAQIFWLTNFWRKSELELGKGWEMVTQVLAASMHYNVASTIYMVLLVPDDLTRVRHQHGGNPQVHGQGL